MTTTLYTFICDKEKVLEMRQEEIKGLGYNIEESLVKIDIRISGYYNDESRYLTVDQLNHFKEALENGAEPWDTRYKVGLVSSYLSSKPLVIEGIYLVDGGNKPHEKNAYLGYGGRKFKYRRLDSEGVIETNNLWNGTEIEEDIKQFMPDNAEWVK